MDRYRKDQESGDFMLDPAQQAVIEHLDALFVDVKASAPSKSRWWERWQRKTALPKGLYLWGGVGRGKTYLMDLFYDALPYHKKMRTHFHRFMRRVHYELTLHKGKKNPLKLVAQQFALEAKVICFDEFFVSEITDAMILANLLESLFEQGVVLVATSNIPPAKLYDNGLQRESFLPAIALLEKHTEILHLDGKIDHRLRALRQAELYHFPLNEKTYAAMDHFFDRVACQTQHASVGGCVSIEGRNIKVLREVDDVIWFDFKDLCDGPRSQSDYIVLAKEYHTVFVSGVAQMEETDDDQARRFIYLVDEFYDRNVKLIISAAVTISQLYVGCRLLFDIQRTYSRLLEMQSYDYLARPHKG